MYHNCNLYSYGTYVKGLITSISQSFVNRARNPIIGAFVLAWVGSNHKIVIEFIFSKSSEKIAFVNLLRFDWVSDFWYPVGLAALYVFGLPVLQLVIDKVKRKSIDKYRLDELHTKKQSEAERDKTTNRSIVESSVDYFHKRHERNLDDWDEQRKSLREEINGKQMDLDTARASLTNLTREVSDKQDEVSSVRDELDAATHKHNLLQAKREELELALKSKDNALNDYQIKIQNLEMKLSSREALNRDIESEIEQLRDSLEATRNKLDKERGSRSVSEDELHKLRSQDMLIKQFLNALSNPNYVIDSKLWHHAMTTNDKSAYLKDILRNHRPDLFEVLSSDKDHKSQIKQNHEDENYVLAE